MSAGLTVPCGREALQLLIVGIRHGDRELFAFSVDDHARDMIRSPGQCAELHAELHSIIGVVQIRRNVQAQQSSLLFVEHERHGILLLGVIRNDNPHLIWNSGGPEHDVAAL